MRIDLRAPGDFDVYALLVSTVAPRPIGWVSTLAANGVPNLAPFSYFGLMADEPPLFALGIGRRNGRRKDTAQNLLDVKQAVVHLVEQSMATAMLTTSSSVEPSVDEFELAGLQILSSEVVAPVRLRDVAVAYECQLYQHIEIARGATDVFLLEGLVAHIRDDLLSGVEPPAKKLGLLGRLGGSDYVTVSETFTLQRK